MEPFLGAWTLVDLAVLGGVALVLPACLGHRNWWWIAATAVAGAAVADQGSLAAVTLALVWPVVAVTVALDDIRRGGPLLFWSRADVVRLVASGYGLVAATWFVLSCAGATPLDIQEPIVELTAVHFTYVGVGAITLAEAALRRARTRSGRRLGAVGLALTGGAPVLVATGFTTGSAVLQIGGAVLMSLGVFVTAALELRSAARPGPLVERILLVVSGLSIWAPMVLAVAWATAQHVDAPALSTADMVPAHGAVNALGFVGAGLAALVLERARAGRHGDEIDDTGDTRNTHDIQCNDASEEVDRADRRHQTRTPLRG
jgi:hypothetical protein